MKEYTTENIRTVALSGHMGSGKTSLAEALLFRNKHTDRLFKVDDGNSTSDFEQEEQKRKVSISATVLPLETKTTKINLLDLPGNRDFVGEIRNCIRMVESVCLVLDATAGVEVGAEMAFEYAEEFGKPVFAYVSKVDKERANFAETVQQMSDILERTAIPVCLPMGEAENYKGVIDLLKMKAYLEDESGNLTPQDIPADMKDAADEARAALVEAAAEGDDELTMKFLEDEPLTEEEVLTGLKGALKDCRFIPVLCGASLSTSGVASFMNFVTECVPSPADVDGFTYVEGDEEKTIAYDSDGEALAFVFKTVVDDFAGRLNFFKIIRGSFKSDSDIDNVTKGKHERIAHLLSVRGKKNENVHQLFAGDIGCVAKSASIVTWDTLGAVGSTQIIPATIMPAPTCHRAVFAASKTDEDKLGMSLHRITEQDCTITVRRDPETHQTVLQGMGETHIDVAVSRLKNTAKIDVLTEIPKVAYRETIRKSASGSYRHKKQSGGRGQFGEVHMTFEPNDEGAGFEFDWKVVGGNVPTNYQSAVQKGVVQAMERGIVAGNPAVDIKAICFDGKYHDVDSSDMAFMIASSMAFRQITRQANPVIMEPIVKVKVTVPEGNMGDVMGDFSSKRGRVLGSSSIKNKAIVEAHVPMSEMFTYSRELRSMTGGRGVYSMELAHYEQVPREVQDKLIDEYEKSKTEDE